MPQRASPTETVASVGFVNRRSPVQSWPSAPTVTRLAPPIDWCTTWCTTSPPFILFGMKRTAGECIEWPGFVSRHTGYGSVSLNGQTVGAHRAAYELVYGKIPDGLVIDHLCRNRRCINPLHLEAVTQSENIKRMWRTRARSWRDRQPPLSCPVGHELSGTRFCSQCYNASKTR